MPASESGEAASHDGVRVLLLEDSALDAELIEVQLQRTLARFEIRRAHDRDGYEEALRTFAPDIILCDYALPAFDGTSALRLAQAIAPQTPFIFVSGMLGEEFAIDSLKDGATDYVLKQRLSRLPAAVRRALGEARERRERLRAEARLQDSLQALRNSEDALRALNEGLERRVEERTRELRAQILERERVEDTLRRMQRLEAVGQLTAGVAHDFNNLLTVVLTNIDLMRRGGDETVFQRRLSHIREAAERGSRLTAQLLAFSRRQRLEPKATDLNETVAGMTDLLRSSLGGGVRLDTDLADDLWPALVDPTQIEMAILNLAINARDAMDGCGRLSIQTHNAHIDKLAERPEAPSPGDYVRVSVADSGSGMSADVLAKVFEPFFTTKDVGKGSGLGLSQVLGFVQQSGGGVHIETAPEQGTRVDIFLPRAKQEASALDAPTVPSAHHARVHASGRLLVVDDDPPVREATAATLRCLGYTVVEAASAPAALNLIDRDRFDLLLIDFAMPGMNGAELAARARQRRPGQPILFVTGYADFAALSGDETIQKPYLDEALAERVARLLAERPTTPA
jgi:signal transduction histidine kinase